MIWQHRNICRFLDSNFPKIAQQKSRQNGYIGQANNGQNITKKHLKNDKQY